MIGALGLLFLIDDLSASRFFPLVPGDRWAYEDTAEPGMVFETLVKKEVNPQFDSKDAALIERPERFFPVEQIQDGKVLQTICYREKDNTLLEVGTGIDHPIVARPIMVVSRQPFSWDYYGDNISEYLTEAIHYKATSQFGPQAQVLGKTADTLVVTMLVTAGPKKIGIELKQVWRYAADIGLYEVDEDGHVGKNQVHHIRRLTKFTPGGNS